MKYDKILKQKIEDNIDENYRNFLSKIVPDVSIVGVRIPTLRKIAKEFSHIEDLLENITLDSYEVVSVACYYIGYTTKRISILKKRLDFILPYIDNWAICDTFVSSLKVLKSKKEEFYPFLREYLKSEEEYTLRFAIVCLLSYYMEEQYIEEIFCRVILLQNKSYYIDMAISWLVSVSFVKFKEKTLSLLESKRLSLDVQNKSISKICDSLRVSQNDKNFIKNLKF